MPPASPRPLWAGRTAALLGIVLVAINLRTAVAAVSPIVDRISDELPIDAPTLGLIGAAPPIAFAVSGLLAPLFSRALGLERALMVAILAMTVGHLGRALAPNTTLLLVGTIVALLGIGVGNVLLPPIIKRYFPDRVGLITSGYATLMAISTAVPALVAVPVADAAGWRVSLGSWFLVAFVALIPWLVQLAAHRAAGGAPEDPDQGAPLAGGLWRSPTAWAITAVFAVSSLNAYAAFAWLPSIVRDLAGSSEAEAGALLALFAIAGLPASVIVPILASRMRDASPLAFAGVAFFLLGYGGLLLAPAPLTALWVLLIGLGPMLFPLALVLINLRTRGHRQSVALSGFVQGIGYVAGCSGPVLVGLMHDASGEWTGAIVFLLSTNIVAVIAGFLLRRPVFVDEEVARRR